MAGPSLLDLLRAHAARTPGAPCLTFEGDTLSFAELDARASQVANALAAAGIVPGDRVALLARATPVSYELVYGCAKAGAIFLPINWRLSAREVAAILADGAPRIIVAADELLPLLAAADGQPATISLDDYAAWRDASDVTDAGRTPAPNEAAMLLYTSGTTGTPKGVAISHGNLSFVERTAREAWQFDAQSVNLVAMPLFHIGGIGYGMMALSQGGHSVLLAQPDPDAVFGAIARYGVTHGFFVPTVIQRLVEAAEAEGRPPPGMRLVVYGAAPIGEALLKRAIAAFECGFTHAYGMTETAGTVISLAPADHHTDGPELARLRSCGKPFPWVELDLVDPASEASVPAGAVGEIRVRSGMTMLGYWNKPAETASAFAPGGWLRTGDAAYRDADGFVYIHDRYKDMIVSGGENIYPTEIEGVLGEHPDVAEVAVIGVPHERWGETPAGFVVVREGARPSEAELLDFTRARLARYKCPSSVTLVAALPRNASGKLLKHEMKKPGWSAGL